MRLNLTMNDELRDRVEKWRASQYQENGFIPSLTDAAKILLHKGLVAEGCSPTPTQENE